MTNTFTISQKAMAKHLRGRLKHERIKARVRMTPGHQSIQVFNVEHDVPFTEREQRMVRHIAKCNGLTEARGLPIDVYRMTDPRLFEFYPPAPWGHDAP